MSKWKVWAASAVAVVAGAGSAAAQSTDFGPITVKTTGGTTEAVFVVDPSATGVATLDLTYAGDVRGNQNNEEVRVFIDGNLLATLNPTPTDCTSTGRQTLAISATDYATAAADGSIVVTFDTGSRVQPNACDNANFDYVDPFTAFTDDSTGFVVQGRFTPPLAAPLASGGPGSTESQVASVAGMRGGLSLLYTPDPQDRIDRLDGRAGRGSVSVAGLGLLETDGVDLQVDRDHLAFSSGAMAAQDFTFWSEGAIVQVDDGAFDDGRFYIIHAGIDRRVGDRALVGLSLQVDHLNTTNAATDDEYDGRGWMFGPYGTMRLRDALYLDGRLAFGQVATDVTLGAGGAEEYDSDRALLELRLTGATALRSLTVEPYAELNYYSEESDAFGAVAATETDISQGVLGGRVSREIAYSNGVLVPYAEAAMLYSEVASDATLATGSYAQGIDGVSAEIELGTSFANPNGTAWSFNLRHHLGDDISSTGLWVDLTLPF
ncbi:MAG: autotransporter outer membrane beta-barrel domain-containing protein [Pseudomonadota bacterium]